MSEPLSNCNMAATDSLSNIVFSQNLGYDASCNSGVQMANLEPVSEEARLRASSNFDSLNILNGCSNADKSDFYIKSEDSMMYSSPDSGAFNSYDSDGRVPPKNSVQRLNPYIQQYQHPHKPVTTPEASKNIENSILNKNASHHNSTNSAKGIRKFHFINAFIPSFIFVVIAMTLSAVVVLESDSDLFGHIRSLPEMVSLRYQYYQPLKEYILQKIGHKT